MGLRLTMRRTQVHDDPDRHYNDGYHDGYAKAMDTIEDRRGRRSRAEMPEHHQIGFTPHPAGRWTWGHDASHHAAGEEEHEEMGKAYTLDPRMETLLEFACDVLDHPPSTWDAMLKRHDYHGIAKMEGKELLAALEEHKSSSDIRKELAHAIAAALQLILH